MNAPEGRTRFGVAAILGAPNAGKSTLINRLVGQKVAIVTHKVQTTRFAIRGVAMEGNCQILLVDTPGIFAPKKRLERAMVRAAWSAAEGTDALIHLVDAQSWAAEQDGRADGADLRANADVRAIMDRLKADGRKAILALNKVDSLRRDTLLPMAKTFSETGTYSDILMISALKGDGIERLKDLIVAACPEGPWHFPEDQAADAPLRLLASEITREKLMLRLHDEIPYESAVETETWEERRDGSVRIEQTIYVAREGQKKIVLGKGGQAIKAIGEAARLELSQSLDRPVHLFLFVKVREHWADDRQRYDAMGLDFDS